MAEMQPKIRPRPFNPDASTREFAAICERLAQQLQDFLDNEFVPEYVADAAAELITEVVNSISIAQTHGEFAGNHLRTLACQYGLKKGE